MVDEEAQRIREEVIRAMAEQGDDIDAPGVSVDDILDSEAAPVAVPAWENVAEVAAQVRANDSLAEENLSPEDVERLFLETVFEDVRTRSADAKLTEPSQWLEAGLVPEHFTADDWEMFVYEYLEERKAQREEVAVAQPTAPIRTATRTVGVPRMFRAEEPEEQEPAEAPQPEGNAEDDSPNCHPERSVEDAESKDPEQRNDAEPAGDDAPLFCDDIVVLMGKHSYYLYSSERMTDAYARWSFLASEDDRVLTFVECVRDESRKYPRPMEASSLSNEPFNLSSQEIDELWQVVRDGGAYPDLDTLTASNGDVYYFSTDYLTPKYAASLAEWNSVERDMFL